MNLVKPVLDAIPKNIRNFIREYNKVFFYILLFSFSFLFLNYISSELPRNELFTAPSFFYIFCASLAFIIFVFSGTEIMSASSLYGDEAYNTWWRYILKIISFFANLSSFGWMVILIVIHTEKPESVNIEGVSLLFKILLVALVYNIFCLIFIFFRYEVAEFDVVSVKNKLYYPDQVYKKWPFKYSKGSYIFNKEIRFSFFKEEWTGKDFSQVFSVRGSVSLNIEKAKEEGLTELDPKGFTVDIGREIKAEIEKNIKSMTCSEFVKGNLYKEEEKKEFRVRDFPLVWDGKYSIES